MIIYEFYCLGEFDFRIIQSYSMNVMNPSLIIAAARHSGTPIISLIPKPVTIEDTGIMSAVLSFFGKKHRKLTIKYYEYKDKLCVGFVGSDNGPTFLQGAQSQAEEWIRQEFKISPLVGQEIVTEMFSAQQHFHCPSCKAESVQGGTTHVAIIGTRSQVEKTKTIELQPNEVILGLCPSCDDWMIPELRIKNVG